MKLLFENGKEKKMREWNVAMTTDFAGESKSTDEIFETLKKIRSEERRVGKECAA